MTREQHEVVSQEEWLVAREAHLVREKDLTRLRDLINAERRALPWVHVEKKYVFDTPEGKKTLGELFEGRSQLIVQHFMFGPGWKDGCIGCSFKADHVDGARLHLEQHDVSFVAVSRAPLTEIEAFRKRMGWDFRWVSSQGNDFNFDYHVSFTEQERELGKVYYNYAERDFESDELSGNSVFYKDTRGNVFHTYSTYGRGDEMVVGAYMYLDLTPMGRNENGPAYNLMDWVRHHARYGVDGSTDRSGRFTPSLCGCGEEHR